MTRLGRESVFKILRNTVDGTKVLKTDIPNGRKMSPAVERAERLPSLERPTFLAFAQLLPLSCQPVNLEREPPPTQDFGCL